MGAVAGLLPGCCRGLCGLLVKGPACERLPVGRGTAPSPLRSAAASHPGRSAALPSALAPHLLPARSWLGMQVPGLEPFRGSLEEIYANFNKYKRTVPVR